MDTRYERIRRDGAMISPGMLIVVSIHGDGYRKVMGVWFAYADLERYLTGNVGVWELKERGLCGKFGI